MMGWVFDMKNKGSALYALIGSLVALMVFGLVYITFDNVVRGAFVDAAIDTGTALPDDLMTLWTITIPIMFIFALFVFAIKNAQREYN